MSLVLNIYDFLVQSAAKLRGVKDKYNIDDWPGLSAIAN